MWRLAAVLTNGLTQIIMTQSYRSDMNSECLVLRGEMTVYHAESFKSQLLSRLENSTELEVDLHHVTELDSAGIQVLMAAKKEAQKRGLNIRLIGHSRPVLEVFELLNLSAFFGDPVLLAGARHPGSTNGDGI